MFAACDASSAVASDRADGPGDPVTLPPIFVDSDRGLIADLATHRSLPVTSPHVSARCGGALPATRRSSAAVPSTARLPAPSQPCSCWSLTIALPSPLRAGSTRSADSAPPSPNSTARTADGLDQPTRSPDGALLTFRAEASGLVGVVCGLSAKDCASAWPDRSRRDKLQMSRRRDLTPARRPARAAPVGRLFHTARRWLLGRARWRRSIRHHTKGRPRHGRRRCRRATDAKPACRPPGRWAGSARPAPAQCRRNCIARRVTAVGWCPRAGTMVPSSRGDDRRVEEVLSRGANPNAVSRTAPPLLELAETLCAVRGGRVPCRKQGMPGRSRRREWLPCRSPPMARPSSGRTRTAGGAAPGSGPCRARGSAPRPSRTGSSGRTAPGAAAPPLDPVERRAARHDRKPDPSCSRSQTWTAIVAADGEAAQPVAAPSRLTPCRCATHARRGTPGGGPRPPSDRRATAHRGWRLPSGPREVGRSDPPARRAGDGGSIHDTEATGLDGAPGPSRCRRCPAVLMSVGGRITNASPRSRRRLATTPRHSSSGRTAAGLPFQTSSSPSKYPLRRRRRSTASRGLSGWNAGG